MIDIGASADGLSRDRMGRWVTGTPGEAVSYPDADSGLCFGIEDSSFWFAHRNALIGEMASRFPPMGAIFDIGGGNGFVARGLADRGHDVVLVEPGHDASARALDRGLTNVVCGTLAAARFHPRTMGAAGLFDVIEHIENEVDFLRGLRSLLKEDAPVYLTVPAFSSLWSSDDEVAGHFRRYRLRTLALALNDAGFDLLYGTYVFSFLVPAVALFRAIPSRLGRHRPGNERSMAREHGTNRWSRALVAPLLATERALIARGVSLPFGASILAVARGRRETEGILQS